MEKVVIDFLRKQKKANDNISKLFNPMDRYHRQQRDILRNIRKIRK